MLRGLLPESALLAWAAVLAPVVEEMYFRGRLLDAFTPKLGPGWAGTISSLAFAAIHGIPAFFPAYLVFAFVLLALRRRTGGLAAPILAHMINNAFALIG
jgi:membrane protease YdiL (CAAX protease family)